MRKKHLLDRLDDQELHGGRRRPPPRRAPAALADPVAAWVPELAALKGPTADSAPISVEHLLTMSAGFPTDDPWGDRQQGLDLDRFGALFRGGPSPRLDAWARASTTPTWAASSGGWVTAAGGLEYAL